jgi:SAM-dependent methyltransferase
MMGLHAGAPPSGERQEGAAAVIWHDVECGGYGADLALWEEMTASTNGPVLDLGCGTGRVAIHLARRGHHVTGLDSRPELLGTLEERAAGLPVTTVMGDARDFALGARFALVLAPMQLIQLLPGAAARLACLRRVAAHLEPGGRAALALVEELPEAASASPPLPDTREIEGWVYSSLPLDARHIDESLVVRRLRQTVSPAGELLNEENEVELRTLTAAQLEQEGREAGLLAKERRRVPETEAHVGSTVVVLEREA